MAELRLFGCFAWAFLIQSVHGFGFYYPIHRNFHFRSRHSSNQLFVANNAQQPIPSQDSYSPAVFAFIDAVHSACETQTLASCTLEGLSKNAPKNVDPLEYKSQIRGSIRTILGRLVALDHKIVLQMTIKHHLSTDIVKNWSLEQIKPQLTGLWTDSKITSAKLTTLTTRSQLSRNRHGEWVIRHTNIDVKDTSNTRESKIIQSHDRVKNFVLHANANYWHQLGITTVNGQIKNGMQRKWIQCQRFVEIVANLVSSTSSRVSIVDMGCGRGYLTFALHSHLLENNFNVTSVGVELRRSLVDQTNGIAKACGFDTLSFIEGSIQSYQHTYTSDSNNLSILMALHACDTATDDSLWFGIRNNCDIIVAAPCCHQELRPQLDAAKNRSSNPLEPVLRHPIYRERMAETLTDAIRAILLELANYSVQLVEFVPTEHSPKNLLLVATRRERPRSQAQMLELRSRLISLCEMNGILTLTLARLMGEPLVLEPPPITTTRTRSFPSL